MVRQRGKLHLLGLNFITNFPVVQIRAAFTHLHLVFELGKSRLASSLTHCKCTGNYFLCQSIQNYAGFLKAAALLK